MESRGIQDSKGRKVPEDSLDQRCSQKSLHSGRCVHDDYYDDNACRVNVDQKVKSVIQASQDQRD